MSDTVNKTSEVHSSLTSAAEGEQQNIESSLPTNQSQGSAQQEPSTADVTMQTSSESQPAQSSASTVPISSQEESKREGFTAIGEPGK